MKKMDPNTLTKPQLIAELKKHGVKGYSNKNKPELLQMLVGALKKIGERSDGRTNYLEELTLIKLEPSSSLWTIPLDLKLVIASQDYQVFKIILNMFEDVREYYNKFDKLLAIQKDKFTTKEEGDGVAYRLDGKLHRELDQPAIIYKNGMKVWYSHGQLHRDGDLPAIIRVNGGQEWWKNNKLHRVHGPAIIRAKRSLTERRPGEAGDVGTQEWWIKGRQIHPPNR